MVQLRLVHVDAKRRVCVVVVQNPRLGLEAWEAAGRGYVAGQPSEVCREGGVAIGRVGLKDRERRLRTSKLTALGSVAPCVSRTV